MHDFAWICEISGKLQSSVGYVPAIEHEIMEKKKKLVNLKSPLSQGKGFVY